MDEFLNSFDQVREKVNFLIIFRNFKNLIESKRVSMTLFNRLQKFWKFQINFQQEKIHQWPVMTEVKIQLPKQKLNMRSGSII